MITRKHIFVSGWVQGVGFRQSARSRARELYLSGWVHNLPDGRVELCVQGEQDIVIKMEAWCRAGTHFSRVTGITVSEEAPIGDEAGFEVR